MPLKGREELGVYKSRLRVFELLSHVSCQSEVWVLTKGSIKPFASGGTAYTWSIAQGMRHGISDFLPNMFGKVFENEGAA
jgi:hypothetical protein